METLLSIELLGGLRIKHGAEVVTRFRTQKTASLFAYLAYYLHRTHPREELVELLWPDSDPEAGRTSLRTALASLRRQLEPEGVAEGSLLISDRLSVRLNTAGFTTDVIEFESHVTKAERETDFAARIAELEAAETIYRGPLLPGFYDDWIVDERERLQRRHITASRALALEQERTGNRKRAIEIAHRVVAAEPLLEDAWMDLVRLYATEGQVNSAMRHFREMERTLKREVGEEPTARSRAEFDRLIKSASTIEPVSLPQPTPQKEAPSQPEPVAAATALRPPLAPAPRLPMQLTPFFGRLAEVAKIREAIVQNEVRLLTLTGMGGSGKTRLAIESVRQLSQDFENQMWFISLVDVSGPEALPSAIAHGMGLERSSDIEPMEQIVQILANRRALIFLDNFEHLTESGTPLIIEFLERLPQLTILVTSRQRLDIGGEVELAVQPLPVPEAPGTPEQMEQFASVQLFLDRARASRPGFQLTRENGAAIAALCEQLEGLPLALELAAAWASTLTPSQMLSRLSQRFDLLTSRRRDLPHRHRTLRAAIEWSDRLLEPELRVFFSQLSVFRGGFTLEAAEEVCSDPLALSNLLQLRERSLAIAEEADGEMRYRLLETLRDYAAERLTPEELLSLQRSHAQTYASLAERAEPNLRGPDRLQWLHRLESEQDNFRAALTFCLKEKEAEIGLRMGGALAEFWAGAGYAKEGLILLLDLLALPVPSGLVRAKALAGAATLMEMEGKPDRVLALLEESLALYSSDEHAVGQALALRKLQNTVFLELRDSVRAHELLKESLSISESVDDRPGMAASLCALGNVARDREDYTTAESLYLRGVALYRQISDLYGVAYILGDMGYMYTAMDDYTRAETAITESLELYRRLNDKVRVAHALWLLARVSEARDDLKSARAVLEEAATIARESGAGQQASNVLFQLAIVAERERKIDEAYDLYTECFNLARLRQSDWGAAQALSALGRVTLLGDRLAEARTHTTESLMMRLTTENPRGVAACISVLGQIALKEGDYSAAATLIGAAESVHATGDHLYPLQQTYHDLAVTELGAAMGLEALAACHHTGYTLPPSDAIALALESSMAASG